MLGNVYIWQLIVYIIGAMCAIFAVKKTIWNWIWKRHKIKEQTEKFPDEISRVDDELRSVRYRLEKLEATAEKRNDDISKINDDISKIDDDISEMKVILLMASRAIYASLTGNEALITKAKEEMLNNIKF